MCKLNCVTLLEDFVVHKKKTYFNPLKPNVMYLIHKFLGLLET